MIPTSLWSDSKYSATHYGTKLLKELFDGQKVFSYPKSLYAVKDIIKLITADEDIILDFFGGSGTTAHAVLLQNKEDGMKRKFILCEQMDYVQTVTCERVKKVLDQEKLNDTFIYCELLELTDKLRKEIMCANEKNINEVFFKVSKSPYVCAYVDKKNLTEELFNEMSCDEKKDCLLKLLDLNMLYVNYSDIDDETYNVDNYSKEFTKKFYGEL